MTGALTLSRTHGGMLMTLPPPAEVSIADELVRAGELMYRSRDHVTIRALNAWALYRLGTLEHGAWTATLVEWAPA